MGTTVNFVRSSTVTTLGAKDGAYTAIINGALTTASFITARAGSVEYVEAPTASAPAATLRGHLLRENEDQVIATVAASTSIWARAAGSEGADLVVTPGNA